MRRETHQRTVVSALDRRTFLRRAGIATSLAALAGCLDGEGESADDDVPADGSNDFDTVPEFPEIDDPPAAVYVPTHREAMRMIDPIEAGPYVIGPMLSYPHPFWLVDGDETVTVTPDPGLGVHLMFTVWDAETGIVLPVDTGVELRIEKDGTQVGSPRQPWPMISQEMGFHFGDNVPLETFGTHTVTVTLPPLSVETTGELTGRFTDTATTTFDFEYDESFLQDVVGGVEYLDEDLWGQRGALEPMDHGSHGSHEHEQHDGHEHEHDQHDHDQHEHHIPYSSLPPAEDYPGTLLTDPTATDADDTELPTSGDAKFVVSLFDPESRFTDDRYLLVSPRTPYNRVPLADMALRVKIDRGDERVVEKNLVGRIDDEFDLHYGVGLDDVEPGDSITVLVDSPPQVARHQGYETAFLDMPPIELEVQDT